MRGSRRWGRETIPAHENPTVDHSAGPDVLSRHGEHVECDGVHHDAALVIAAQALLANGTDNDTLIGYLQRTWQLDLADAHAAVAAAQTLAGHDHGIRIAHRPDHQDGRRPHDTRVSESETGTNPDSSR